MSTLLYQVLSGMAETDALLYKKTKDNLNLILNGDAATSGGVDAWDDDAMTNGSLNYLFREISGGISNMEVTTPGASAGGGRGMSTMAVQLLITILNAGVYVSDQSMNIAALSAELMRSPSEEDTPAEEEVEVTQSGSTLTLSNVPTVTQVSQSGAVLTLS